MFYKNSGLGRPGITLIELLIVITAGLIMLGAISVFFVRAYSNYVKQTRELIAETSMLKLTNLMTADLLKAGYNVPDTYNAVDWDNKNKTLIIRYVDYTKSGCEKKQFAPHNSCSYVVEYLYKDGNIQRRVDASADGSFKSSSLLDDKQLKVTGFDVFIYPDKKSVLVNIKYSVPKKKEKNYKFLVSCPNWN